MTRSRRLAAWGLHSPRCRHARTTSRDVLRPRREVPSVERNSASASATSVDGARRRSTIVPSTPTMPASIFVPPISTARTYSTNGIVEPHPISPHGPKAERRGNVRRSTLTQQYRSWRPCDDNRSTGRRARHRRLVRSKRELRRRLLLAHRQHRHGDQGQEHRDPPHGVGPDRRRPRSGRGRPRCRQDQPGQSTGSQRRRPLRSSAVHPRPPPDRRHRR